MEGMGNRSERVVRSVILCPFSARPQTSVFRLGMRSKMGSRSKIRIFITSYDKLLIKEEGEMEGASLHGPFTGIATEVSSR